MAIGHLFEDGREKQAHQAAERLAAHASERVKNVEALRRPGGIALVNSDKEVAERLDRVTRYLAGDQLPMTAGQVPTAAPAEIIDLALERAVTRGDPAAASIAQVAKDAAQEVAATARGRRRSVEPASDTERAGVVLEKIIGTADFVDIRYLESGVAAARAVCRVVIRDRQGRTTGYGTGSLVSPRLLLTNNHVLESGDVARLSAAEFNYQDGIDGQPLRSELLAFDPDAFFFTDPDRDFALVAIAAGEQAVTAFGLNRLIEAQGKAIKGDFVTIVQHPRGEKKQVALRENKIVDELDLFLHYSADTEPGSSGSPVFNDQWEIVALHHASVRAQNPGEYGAYLNEGVRASQILQFVRQQPQSAATQPLVDGLFSPERILLAAPLAVSPATAQRDESVSPQLVGSSDAVAGSGSVSLTVPLRISVSLGEPTAHMQDDADVSPPDEGTAEAIAIDPKYGSRRGYDPDFLGRDTPVPLPTLPDELAAKAARPSEDEDGHELRYHHFSVVLNKERRLAFFTAVNIDGRSGKRLRREPDRWFLDPRLPAADQTGEAVYADNDLDRGHLVRRLDPAWGRTERTAKRANDDTFHFTNCTPQHKNFNQNKTTWAGLEDYILDHASNLKFRANVVTGPVFAEDDDDYRGVKLPRQYWKVVTMVKSDGSLSATGYLLSQERLLRELEATGEEEFSYGSYRTYQVPISRIEDLTEISFGQLRDSDPLEGLEAEMPEREIDRPEQLVL